MVKAVQIGGETGIIPPGSFATYCTVGWRIEVVVSVFGGERHATMIWKRVTSSSYKIAIKKSWREISDFRYFHGLAPAYIEDLLVSYIPRRYLRSAKKNLLAVPGFKLNSYSRRAFSVAAPLLWNSLPQHVRDAESLDIFKRQLKTVLFKRAF